MTNSRPARRLIALTVVLAFTVWGQAGVGRGAEVEIDLGDLDGSNGFALYSASSWTGMSVAGAGDVNGDGYHDVIVGAPGANAAHVVFGAPSPVSSGFGFPDDGVSGFVLQAPNFLPHWLSVAGFSVAGAGDVNGDGYDDVIVGDPNYEWDAGMVYVVFGAPTFPGHVMLSSLDGTNGFQVSGRGEIDEEDGWRSTESQAGYSVAGAGDINDDGFDDVIIGGPLHGDSYVIYGRGTPFPSRFDPAWPGYELHPEDGFVITGGATARTGYVVAGAGDVNDDGIDDILVGSSKSRPLRFGTYVIYGSGVPIPSIVDLHYLEPSTGFHLAGAVPGAGPIGDVDGDGIDDMLLGRRECADCGWIVEGDTYEAYVVFGSSITLPTDVDDLNGGNGFRITGMTPTTISRHRGRPWLGGADVNGDGLADILIGHAAIPDDGSDVGAVYVVYGSSLPRDSSVFDVASLDGLNGMVLRGAGLDNRAGRAVGGAGDVNGDGIGDLIIGAHGTDALGAAYVVNGVRSRTCGGKLITIIGTPGDDVIHGTNSHDVIAALAGDDVVRAGNGWDVICGGPGDDILWGEHGSDVLLGQGGADRLLGQGMADELLGGAGDDYLAGGVGPDTLSGGSGDDRLIGNTGGDDLSGGPGIDRLNGGPGPDLCSGEVTKNC